MKNQFRYGSGYVKCSQASRQAFSCEFKHFLDRRMDPSRGANPNWHDALSGDWAGG